MRIHIEENNAFIEITGFRDIWIKDADEIADIIRDLKTQETAIQFLSAEVIATWEHLYFAILDALLGFKNGYNISRSLAIEVVLYASAQRQIRKAIDVVGVKSGCTNVALVIVGCNEASVRASLAVVAERFGKKPDDTVLELSKTKKEKIQRVFGISDTEMEAVTSGNIEEALVNLIIERMALLATLI